VLAAVLWCLWLNHQVPGDLLSRGAINLWFDSDVGRVVGNMTILEEGHGSTFKHPVFSILLLPPTRVLMAMGLPRDLAIASLLALNAGLFLLLLDRLAARMGLRPLDRALLGGLTLASSAFVFWFAMPETFPFGATTLLAALYVLARALDRAAPEGGSVLAWGLALILAMSMTITNILMLVAGAGVALWQAALRGPVLRRGIIGAALGLAALAALALVQNQFFGNAGLFFNPFALAGERQFIDLQDSTPFLARLQTLWLQVMVAGTPQAAADIALNAANVPSGGLHLDGTWPQAWPGVAALAGWVVLILAAGVAWLRRPVHDATPTIAAVFVLLNTLLHLAYGATVFLYLAHFLGPVVLLVAGGLLRGPQTPPPGLRLLVAAVAILALYANVTTFQAALGMAEEIFLRLPPA
jgi:hypothetical protein